MPRKATPPKKGGGKKGAKKLAGGQGKTDKALGSKKRAPSARAPE